MIYTDATPLYIAAAVEQDEIGHINFSLGVSHKNGEKSNVDISNISILNESIQWTLGSGE